MKLFAVTLVTALLGLTTAAFAQTTTSARVVASCGGITYVAGSPQPLTIDTTGTLCTVSGGGGGGTVTIASGAVASGAYSSGSIASGAVASGAIASGAVASGAYAAGSLAAGAGVSGWDLSEGALGDAAWTSGNGSVIAILKNLSASLTASAADPCSSTVKSTADFESGSSGGSIITGNSSKQVYLCSISIVTSTAANVLIDEGTGSSVCTGGTPGPVFLAPDETAGHGAAFAANGGIQAGSGVGTVAQTATGGDNVCVVFTTTNSPQVNVHVSYVQK